jgi:hypothetical protein
MVAVLEMLQKSDVSVAEVLKEFNAHDVDVGLLVPTKIGIEKSIMDATASVRDFLTLRAFHDYELQGKGPEHKVVRRAYYVFHDRVEETSVSLYRPETKNGDPRIWFGKLGAYADPFNLLALIVKGSDIYVVNCSKPGLLRTLQNPSAPLGAFSSTRPPTLSPDAAELLGMIEGVSRLGFIPSLRSGDTGVGMTLESQLGIATNSNRAPDFRGIEIKAKRISGRAASGRVTLFSQVPDWNLSPIGSAWNLLSQYGYLRNGKLRLNHEISARGPNSIGFLLRVDADRDWLRQNHFSMTSKTLTHLVTWQLRTLREALTSKHPQTFWVGARVRKRGGLEEFHYVQVQHTRKPKVHNFDALLESGVVTVDYLMSQKKEGGMAVRDHGYLFKIAPGDFGALFPPPAVYALC